MLENARRKFLPKKTENVVRHKIYEVTLKYWVFIQNAFVPKRFRVVLFSYRVYVMKLYSWPPLLSQYGILAIKDHSFFRYVFEDNWITGHYILSYIRRLLYICRLHIPEGCTIELCLFYIYFIQYKYFHSLIIK